MDLDRGTLARIDRKLLANLEGGEVFRMVRVPVTPAKWSIWKRYCSAAGVSMGRAIMAVIDRELVSVLGESGWDEIPILAGRSEDRLAAREARVESREHEVGEAEERIGRQIERLRRWEDELEAREQRNELGSRLGARPWVANSKVGRNEQCPCGSGLKYKRCHFPGG
jgi:hypothetical protein